MTSLFNSTLLGLGLVVLALSSVAQTVKLLDPTRTVYRCEEAGKVPTPMHPASPDRKSTSNRRGG